MKVILPIKDVPEGSIVTKPTGTKKYEVQRALRIYGEGVEINCNYELQFLMPAEEQDSKNGIMAVLPDYEVKWEIGEEELHDFLSRRLYT